MVHIETMDHWSNALQSPAIPANTSVLQRDQRHRSIRLIAYRSGMDAVMMRSEPTHLAKEIQCTCNFSHT